VTKPRGMDLKVSDALDRQTDPNKLAKRIYSFADFWACQHYVQAASRNGTSPRPRSVIVRVMGTTRQSERSSSNSKDEEVTIAVLWPS